MDFKEDDTKNKEPRQGKQSRLSLLHIMELNKGDFTLIKVLIGV